MGKLSSLNSLFTFKNKETAQEIEKIVSMYEGVLPEEVDNYLLLAHSHIKTKLFVDAKNSIKNVWHKNKSLTLSDVLGLFELALTDIKQQQIAKSDKIMKGSLA